MADENPYTIRTPSAAKQFGIALFFGALVAFLTYKIADSIASPDTAVGTVQTQGAFKFVFYMAALAGGLSFIVAQKVYKWWADKQYAASLGPPQAIARDRKEQTETKPSVPTSSSVEADAPREAMSATERALAAEDPLAQDDVKVDRSKERITD